MENDFRLPTGAEIEAAYIEAGESGPLPLASRCDRSPSLTAWIRQVCNMTGVDEQFIKTGLVMGLNIGIRIGEARR